MHIYGEHLLKLKVQLICVYTYILVYIHICPLFIVNYTKAYDDYNELLFYVTILSYFFNLDNNFTAVKKYVKSF